MLVSNNILKGALVNSFILIKAPLYLIKYLTIKINRIIW